MGVWAFVFMFVVLKIPLAMLLWVVWWAIREVPAEAEEQPRDDEGGGGSHRPRPRRPRPPRRGPHGGPVPRSPRRVRVHRRRVGRPLRVRP
jgi:hypothetical protein